MMLWLWSAVVMAGGDTLELRDSTEGHVAELFYENTGGQRSAPGIYVLEHNGLTIRVWLSLEGTGEERIVVEDADGQHVAFPPEIAIPDGTNTTVQIMRPMY